MKKLYLHIARFFTFLAALQILNMGLFVQDFEPLSSSSSISYNNVINSMVEYVSEVVLNKINAIPESDNKANQDLQAHKHFNYKLINIYKLPALSDTQLVYHSKPTSLIKGYNYLFCTDIYPPPPKL